MKNDIVKNIVNDLTTQIQSNIKKADYFLTAKQKSMLYILFIGIKGMSKTSDEAAAQKQKQELLKKTSSSLTHFEKSTQLLIYTTDNGILVLAHDFNNILESFLHMSDTKSKQKEARPLDLCMGVEFCIVNDSTLLENLKPSIQHAISISNLAVTDRLLISRAVYEIQKNFIEKNKNISIQKYHTLRFPNEKIQTDIFEVSDSRRKLYFPSLVIFRKKTTHRLAAAFLITAVIVLIPLLQVKVFQPIRVVLQGKLPAKVYLDYMYDSPITSIWDPEYQGYLITQDILPGKHVLSYDEKIDIRYIQAVLIHSGDNIIKLNWQEAELATSYIWINYLNEQNWDSHEQLKDTYTVYDRTTFEPIIKKIVFDLRVKVRPLEKNLFQFLFLWEIHEDGKLRFKGGRTIDWDATSEYAYRDNMVYLGKNEHIFYDYNVYIDDLFFKLYVRTSYIEYLSVSENK